MKVRNFTFSATWTVGPLAGGDSTSIAGRPKKTTMVYGFVTDMAGNPIAGATVTLRDANGNFLATYITGADGFYVFFNGMSCATGLNGGACASGTTLSLPAGTYKLDFAAAGYQSSGPVTISVANNQAVRVDRKLQAL